MIDLIIVNYKSADFLKSCLSSIYENINGFHVNIHVIDNGSHDHIHLIKSIFPEINLTINGDNLGFAKAANNIIKKTSAPYVVVLNPDTIIFDGFFDSIISYIQYHPNVGVVGPKILDPDGSIQGSARAFPNFRSALYGRTSFLTRIFPNSPKTYSNIISFSSDGTNPLKVDWVSGACQVIRRNALEDVGLYDERFFLYWEDVDLCKRVKRRGWEIIYFPQAAIEHRVGGSSDHRLFCSIFEFHKSAYQYFTKHMKLHSLSLKAFIFLGISLRFFGILCSQTMQRIVFKIRKKVKKFATSAKN